MRWSFYRFQTPKNSTKIYSVKINGKKILFGKPLFTANNKKKSFPEQFISLIQELKTWKTF